jgi:hypothetical protein
MERPGTNLTIPFSDTSTNINEMMLEQNNIVPSSLPTNKTKRNKLVIAKPTLKSHPPTNQLDTPQDDAHKSYENNPGSEKQLVPTFFAKFKKKPTISNRQPSIADNALKDIIHDLDENPVEEEAFKEEKTPPSGCSKRVHDSRKFLRHLMEQPAFHYTIIVLIMLDLIIVFVDLIVGKLSHSDKFLEIYAVFIVSFSSSKSKNILKQP